MVLRNKNIYVLQLILTYYRSAPINYHRNKKTFYRIKIETKKLLTFGTREVYTKKKRHVSIQTTYTLRSVMRLEFIVYFRYICLVNNIEYIYKKNHVTWNAIVYELQLKSHGNDTFLNDVLKSAFGPFFRVSQCFFFNLPMTLSFTQMSIRKLLNK